MGLFKRAAARGIAHELVRTGLCDFPSKLAMDGAADIVADHAHEMPEVSPEAGHDPEHVAAVANKLVEIAHELMAQSGQTGAAGAHEVAKLSSSNDYDTLAYYEAVDCMDKAAAEVKQGGALMHGGDHQNTPVAAAKDDEVAHLDQAQRPQGEYHEGQGETAMPEAGHVGAQAAHPKTPSNSPHGSNSLKAAAALLHGGDHQNTPEFAAQHNDVAALDLAQRPQGKYLVGKGKANIDVPAVAHVGKEMHVATPVKNQAKGSNSVTRASKLASSLSEDEQAYLELFNKTAADVGPYMPEGMAEEDKIAAIQRMIPLDHAGRQAELDALHKSAASLPEAMEEMKYKAPAKKEEKKKEEKSEHHEEEKEEKKESSLLSQIRSIAAASR